MADKKESKGPKKFVGLHAHSTFSIGDAIGRPKEHIDFAIKNEMDALALTDHGNMNGFSHQYLHAKYLKKKGVPFKAIAGCEAYFVPSLENWQKLYDESREQARLDKVAKKEAETQDKINKLIADVSAGTKEDLITGQAAAELDEETQGGTGVEDEAASKSNKWKNPLFQRNHLVLLPKNSAGLQALFACISHSFIDGFYRFPRMDFALLEKYAKGNIIASSACVAGMPSRIIFDNQVETEWDSWKPNDDNKEAIQEELAEMVARFHQALGPENFYLEIQFNKLGCLRGDSLVTTTEGDIPISSLVDKHKAGEKIFASTFDEKTGEVVEKEIIAAEKTHDEAPLFRVELEDGKHIDLTPNHKVFTNHGWMEARELMFQDDIEILVEEKEEESK